MLSCSAGPIPLLGHAGAKAAFEIAHALHGAAHADGAAELFSLRAGEAGNDHGHAQKLLLKERHAEGSLEHGLEQRVRVGDFFLSLTAAHVGMHHFADDGAGADDGDLDDDVVEAASARCGGGRPSARGFRPGTCRRCRRCRGSCRRGDLRGGAARSTWLS